MYRGPEVFNYNKTNIMLCNYNIKTSSIRFREINLFIIYNLFQHYLKPYLVCIYHIIDTIGYIVIKHLSVVHIKIYYKKMFMYTTVPVEVEMSYFLDVFIINTCKIIKVWRKNLVASFFTVLRIVV